MSNIILDRTMSSFGISIPTGIMLETLFEPTTARYDNERIPPTKIKVDDYSYHFFNLYTLIRNIANSVPIKNIEDLLRNRDFYNVLEDELHIIVSLYEDTKCKPIIFLPDYTQVYTKYSAGKEGELSKGYQEAQIIYNYIKKFTTTTISYINTGYKLPGIDKQSLITTHFPVDLNNNLGKLVLLESHTGRVKYKHDWYTKLHKLGTKDLSIIPFMEETLYLLGDTHMVKPISVRLRTVLYDIAVMKHWTSRTTSGKIKSDISGSKELTEILKQFKKSY
jgi:hypothetical protein